MDSPHLERLSAADCRRLLPTAPVGRLAVPTPNFPTLDPVPFAVVEGELVVAVRAGSAGDAIPPGTVVAFEADVLDRKARQGWSVICKGPVEELDPDVADVVRSMLSPWPAASTDRLLLIRSEQISGQRIVSGSPSSLDAAQAPQSSRAPAVSRRSLLSDEALAQLRKGDQPVGRLVVTVGGEPSIFPVNFALDGEAIIFRTHSGAKLTGITRSLATFEVDQIDASGRGWSITFEGLAQEVLDSDPASLWTRIEALTLESWPGGDHPHVVRITPYAVRGTLWTAVEAVTTAALASEGHTSAA
jgi:nitroimidazol reductase NimA-like FMN-containing flavoprotein (pyridoxamine 5'-phosphate oxidase superfamily)